MIASQKKEEPMDHALLWMDFETTGLDHQKLFALEVGWAFTDLNFEVVPSTKSGIEFSNFYPETGRHPKDDVDLCENDFVVQMHKASGLFASREAADDLLPLYVIENLLMRDIRYVVGDEGAVTLAGSGVGTFDMTLIRRLMPRLAARITYYVIDTGTVERFAQIVSGGAMRGTSKSAAHRVIPDIKYSIDMARKLSLALDVDYLKNAVFK